MKLYVIGNGFDVYHGLNTSYTSFGLYLKKNYWEIYDLLIEHYGFAELNPDCQSLMSAALWSEFEANMSLLNTESVLEANMDMMPSYASESFRDSDRYTLEIEMERILGLLTSELYKAFKEFILDIHFPSFEHKRAVNLDKNAIYLTFNYTDTLARYYAISDDNILFIHEKANENVNQLILGHGIDPKNFEEKPAEPPLGLSGNNLEAWKEDQSDKYDYSLERGKHAINQYFSATFKGTEKIIKNNEGFFTKLSNINEVYILGHSLADVDLPYFQKLVQSVEPDAQWIATFYDPNDEKAHEEALRGLGVTNISVVRMEQI